MNFKPPVMCTTREQLLKMGIPPDTTNLFKMDTLFDESSIQFMNRAIVDNHEMIEMGYLFPQIIPYVLIQKDNLYADYSRKKGAETRLHGSRSIGFGGHIDIDDYAGNTEHTILNGINRELKEELNIVLPSLSKPTLLVDTSNDVGKVHVGLVYIGNITDTQLQTSDEIHDLNWVSADELKQNQEHYESWSRLIIDRL